MGASSRNELPITVADWLEAFDPESDALSDREWGVSRLRRLHGQQMVLDVIAHVQNMPLRLLRVNNLVHLGETFARFIRTWPDQVFQLFTERSPDGSHRVPGPLRPEQARELLAAMQQPQHLATLRDWVLALGRPGEADADELLTVPASLPAHYAEWFLTLLPHLERDVWLTEMANPVPAHNLARMVEHWSLYILMWAWSRAEDLQRAIARVEADTGHEQAIEIFDRALGMDHLGLIVLPAFKRRGREGTKDVALLAGPFVRASAAQVEDCSWFVQPLQRYLRRIERVRGVQGWVEVHEKAPGSTELHDALEGRASLDDYEARRRAVQSRLALQTLLGARMDPSVTRWPVSATSRPVSRANWETMAVLAAWHDRWGDNVYRACLADGHRALKLTIDQHRIALLVSGEPSSPVLTFFSDDAPPTLPVQPDDWGTLEPSLKAAREALEWRWIEGPSTFFARMRERQQAAWTSYIAGINHLLARHSRRDRPEGADNPDARLRTPVSCEEADHLLRGFGGRICRYLLSMARAEVAVIYWLDYSCDPPRLRHVGSAERLIQHRAERQSMLTQFDAAIWEPPVDGQPATTRPGVDVGSSSPYQVYSVAANGVIEPQAEARLASERSDGRPPLIGRLDIFGDTRPLDAVSVPLLFNDRVVGVFGLAGMACDRHFDVRLYPALRLVAQVLAQAMYFQNQVWQMRQLNWLASHVPLEEWRQHDRANEFNPLRRVARCLANIFLCPGVQIWLKDRQNPKRFKLHGSTSPAIFRHDGAVPEHAPWVMMRPMAPTEPAPLHRSIFAFAVDQWAPEGRTAGDDEDLQPFRSGLFIQARFNPDDRRRLTRNYGLQAAEDGSLELCVDFLDPPRDDSAGRSFGSEPLPTLRKALFIDRGWAHLMAFALVRSGPDGPDVVGVVSLHAKAPSGNGRHMPWPPGWRPVVAHVQTYLPYVLMQTESIANPLDDLRRYLLHEGRNELNATSELAGQLKALLGRLTAVDDPPGQVRPWLRRSMTLLEQAPAAPAADLAPGLHLLDRLLTELSDKVDQLLSVERSENMALLGRLIDHQRSISSLGLNFAAGDRIHYTEWIALRASLLELFSAYAADLRSQHVWWSVDPLAESVELRTQAQLWGWMIGDLVHNVAKYALPNSGVEVSLKPTSQPDGKRGPYRLRLSNESTYDAELDQPSRLVLHGVQGSAGALHRQRKLTPSKVSRVGSGIGLWGVDQLASTLGMTLKIEIRPQTRSPNVARYHFDLLIPADMIRR